MNFLRIVSVGILTAAFLSSGEDLTIEKNISGYASLEEGQIVQGTYPLGGARADHVWVQRMYTGLNSSMLFNPLNLKGNLGVEMRVSNEFPRASSTKKDLGQTRRLYFYPYLTEVDLLYHIGDNDRPLISVTAGYFPIKYNQNARNLGEYLFRSGTYPQTLVTDFDFAATRLMGVNISSSPIEGLNLSLILNSNIEWQAVGDLNLSALATYNFRGIFEIGAGFYQSSIVSADPTLTDLDSSNAQDNVKYKNPDGTIGLLTFRGTRLMGMTSFDVKKFIPTDIFGKEDLKLYAEVAVLGLKDYPVTLDGATDYSDISKRMPIMVGFNVPAFKLLDVLSFEAEWFGSLMPNDMGGVVLYDQPIPFTGDRIQTYTSDTTNHQQYRDDNLKWSVYAKRTLAGHFQLVGQIASDHLRWFAQDWTRQEWQEAFRNPNQFYYRFKIAYLF